MTDDIFEYKPDEWDNKYLSMELRLSKYKFKLISDEKIFGLFTFPLFSPEFCNKLVSMLQQFNGWTTGRHPKYSTNDILLEDFDKRFYKIYDCIIKNILVPGINDLYGCKINSTRLVHETFIIRYNPEVQGHLDIHHDHSSFTFCTTLSNKTEYRGGGTYFPKQNNLLKAGQGECVVHPGMFTHEHGVRPITEGERYSIVSFCRVLW
tara:strand:- start:3060 stop:3680 length:621 start_codon:yes stop_codon:yes gene_type:complete